MSLRGRVSRRWTGGAPALQRAALRWLALASVSAAACFSPSIPSGVVVCGDAECPRGLRCESDGYCYRPGEFPDPANDGGTDRDRDANDPGDAGDGGEDPPDYVLGESSLATLAAASFDTFVDGSAETTNHGADAVLRVEKNPERMALLRFNTGSLELVDKTIERGTLSIWSTTDLTSTEIEIYVVREFWSEPEATYLERETGTPWGGAGLTPPSRDAEPIASVTLNDPETRYDIELPAPLVEDWVDDTVNNHGLVFRTIEGSIFYDTSFVSTEGPEDRRPLLNLWIVE